MSSLLLYLSVNLPLVEPSLREIWLLDQKGFRVLSEGLFGNCYVRKEEIAQFRVLTKFLQGSEERYSVVFQQFEYDLRQVAQSVSESGIHHLHPRKSEINSSPLMIANSLPLKKAIHFYDALESARLLNRVSHHCS
ncbi:MAG: hypothetical protein AABY00_02010 [Nanoarchaeota archaeon]